MIKKALPTDYDGNWKRVIDDLFEDLIEFFFPKLYPLIDFTKKVESLEQELLPFFQNDEHPKKDKKITDKLFKVYLKDGTQTVILIHIEVEASGKNDFGERMFVYRYRVYDKMNGIPLTALAIYTGEQIPKDYDTFKEECYGTTLEYKFNTYIVKNQDEEALLASKNPIALVVLATIHASKSKNDVQQRFRFKKRLMELALERNYPFFKIVILMKFVYFLLYLPEELSASFDKNYLRKYKNVMVPGQGQQQNVSVLEAYNLARFGFTITELLKGKTESDKKLAKQKEATEKLELALKKSEQEKAAIQESAAKAKKEASEKVKVEKENAAKVKKEANEKVKAEKENAAKVKKEASEKVKVEKENAAKVKKEASEKVKVEKENATKIKKEANEKVKAEKENAAKIKKEANEKVKAEKENAAKAKKEANEKVVKLLLQYTNKTIKEIAAETKITLKLVKSIQAKYLKNNKKK